MPNIIGACPYACNSIVTFQGRRIGPYNFLPGRLLLLPGRAQAARHGCHPSPAHHRHSREAQWPRGSRRAHPHEPHQPMLGHGLGAGSEGGCSWIHPGEAGRGLRPMMMRAVDWYRAAWRRHWLTMCLMRDRLMRYLLLFKSWYFIFICI